MLVLMIAGISGPCTTVSIEEIGVVFTVYMLRQFALPADESCMQNNSITSCIHTMLKVAQGHIKTIDSWMLIMKPTVEKLKVATGLSA